ncbi:unnamed protein product [Pseudo-nitzschia multistriata]|uniref:Uncharacterized protein n=1 Tax=Pseudo-nitzschia multistriata TaxID=183589 RepID=A0A448ZSX7_9STRA|nr:unnamed protein product [Pseudo-nitzschia multistriata]
MNVGGGENTAGTAGAGEARRCLCHYITEENNGNGVSFSRGERDTTLRCSVCVQNLLRSSVQRHRQALQQHAIAKKECERELASIPRNRIPELQAESQRLREKSAALRKECGEMAVKIAHVALENDTLRETMAVDSSPLERQRLDLERLENGLLEGSLEQAIETATRQVRFLRFQWAQKVFAMHRLQIDPDHIKLTPLQKRHQKTKPGQQLQRRARGIPKISGLPLPNAGPELYGFLPPRELQSALRIVATVTSTVARCLGIVLPHRVLLTFNTSDSSVGDIADTVTEDDLRERNAARSQKPQTGYHQGEDTPRHDSYFSNYPNQVRGTSNSGGYRTAQPVASSSTASLYSMMDTSYFYKKAKKALAKATGQRPTSTGSNSNNARGRPGTATIERSFDATIVAQRLNHATAAILNDVDTTAEAANNKNSSASKFALSTKAMHQGDDFAIALQLLQNNVLTLCIRAGVPVSKLWPAEAMLLNLHELDKFCQQQTTVQF